MAGYQPKTGNNNASREKRFDKVVTGTVETRQNNGRKLVGMLISDDAKNVGSFALMDVLIPSIKKAVVDIVTDGIQMIVYGNVQDGRKRNNKIAYNEYWNEHRVRSYNGDRDNRGYDYHHTNRFEDRDILYDSAREAEEVRRHMLDALDRYRVVTVADLYDMSGLEIPSYTAYDYGWTKLHDIDIVRVRDRYMLRLPRALPID